MDALFIFVENTTRQPVAQGVTALAVELARRKTGTVAVISYGSALRDSSPENTLIDYYVLVDAAAHVSENPVLRVLGHLLPPNVYYAELPHNGRTLRFKYAVLTLAQFTKLVGVQTSNPYLWARFAQPCRIVWAVSDEARQGVVTALCGAARTAFRHAKYLSADNPWQRLFENTYRTELRPENATRAAMIVDADRGHYDQLALLMAGEAPLASSWAAKRIYGKLWSVARLTKAAFTFQGGADYAAWKIERHSGVKIEVTDWQRKHPFLAGIVMLPKLLRRRGLK